MGYGYLLQTEYFDERYFAAMVQEDYHLTDQLPSNCCPSGFLKAMHGEEKALYLYLDYQRRLAFPLEEKAPADNVVTFEWNPFDAMKPGEGMRKRPGMYFGNEFSAAHLWSFLSGNRWRELDTGKTHGPVGTFMREFQQWFEARHPFGKDIPWHRTMLFLVMECPQQSWDEFFECYDLFSEGKSPDHPSRKVEEAVSHVLERLEKAGNTVDSP